MPLSQHAIIRKRPSFCLTFDTVWILSRHLMCPRLSVSSPLLRMWVWQAQRPEVLNRTHGVHVAVDLLNSCDSNFCHFILVWTSQGSAASSQTRVQSPASVYLPPLSSQADSFHSAQSSPRTQDDSLFEENVYEFPPLVLSPKVQFFHLIWRTTSMSTQKWTPHIFLFFVFVWSQNLKLTQSHRVVNLRIPPHPPLVPSESS